MDEKTNYLIYTRHAVSVAFMYWIRDNTPMEDMAYEEWNKFKLDYLIPQMEKCKICKNAQDYYSGG